MNHTPSMEGQVSNFDYQLFSLPEEEVQITAKSFENNEIALLDIIGIYPIHQCPKCGSFHTRQVGKQYETSIVNHLFLSNYLRLKLRIHKRRFECLDCKERSKSGSGKPGSYSSGSSVGSTFLEQFSFLNTKCTYTTTFRTYIFREWKTQSLEELARKFSVSSTLIYDCIAEIDAEDLVQEKIQFLETLETIILGIDEFSFQGRDYMCQITELKTRKVVGILTTNTKEALQEWMSKLPLSILRKITGIASDMNASYKKIIQDWIRMKLKYDDSNPNDSNHLHIAEVATKELGIVDHFHLKQMIMKTTMEVYNCNNWMIKAGHYDEATKDLLLKETKEFNKYRTEIPKDHPLYKHHLYTPEDPVYKPITLGHYLSCRYQDLLLLSGDKLTIKQKHRLNQILYEFDPRGYLKDIYCLKELFFESMESKDTTLLRKAIEEMKASVQYKIETCGKTLKKWEQCIINFFETNITNAFTEGKNTKAKLLKRMAYGYRIKENFQKRLLLCL